MLWVYGLYTYFNSFSAGIVFIRQNLTSLYVRTWRLYTSEPGVFIRQLMSKVFIRQLTSKDGPRAEIVNNITLQIQTTISQSLLGN